MGGEDAGDVAGVAQVEVERSGAPEVAPPGGEQLRASGVVGWEAGDDLAEGVVGEEADLGGAARRSLYPVALRKLMLTCVPQQSLESLV